MKLSRRVVISIFFITTILPFGMFFWPFILNEIITPTALAAWVLLRIFVLSIDQQYYWGAIIFVVLVFLFRLLPQDPFAISSGDFLVANDTMRTIEYWRQLFTLTDDGVSDERTLKQELIHLVASLYASKQRTSPNFTFYDALQRGEIPLPDHIHTFLFPDEPKESGRSLKKWMQFVLAIPRKWIRRWTGQEIAEYYRMIDEILSFMETSLEIKNDDGKFTPNEN